jgi:hypothetical protein
VFLSIVLSISRPLGDVSLDSQSVFSIVVFSCNEPMLQGAVKIF